MGDLERDFERDMLADSKDYTQRTRTSPTRYLQMIGQHGGVETARILALSVAESEGFTRAWEHQCLNLTAEHLMIYGKQGAYQSLFGEEALKAARKRLKAYGVSTAII